MGEGGLQPAGADPPTDQPQEEEGEEEEEPVCRVCHMYVNRPRPFLLPSFQLTPLHHTSYQQGG